MSPKKMVSSKKKRKEKKKKANSIRESEVGVGKQKPSSFTRAVRKSSMLSERGEFGSEHPRLNNLESREGEEHSTETDLGNETVTQNVKETRSKGQATTGLRNERKGRPGVSPQFHLACLSITTTKANEVPKQYATVMSSPSL